MVCERCCSPGKFWAGVRRWWGVALQLAHFLVALALLCVALAEFCAEPPLFDVLGPMEDRRAVPPRVFQNISGTLPGSMGLRRVMDLPILGLFFVYFLTVVWLKCKGSWAWLLTSCMIGAVLVVLTVNLWAGQLLMWKYFSSRSVAIIINVLTVAFVWSVVIVALLAIRNWFPFKIKKIPATNRLERVVLYVWNTFALCLVLTLCLLIWFSRLYNSWACMQSTADVLLLCQFTNLVQCWQCANAESCLDLEDCVEQHNNNTFHCLSPLFTLGPPQSSFCVFNYNIGAFTFLAVFSYVGGIYFFMRTTLNAFVKCFVVLVAVVLKSCRRVMRPKEVGEEGDSEDGRHSLLASLPKSYLNYSNSATP